MENRRYKQIGHFIRWFLELLVIWMFVLPETGPWTCFALMMITIGIEWDHIVPSDWSRKAPVK